MGLGLVAGAGGGVVGHGDEAKTPGAKDADAPGEYEAQENPGGGRADGGGGRGGDAGGGAGGGRVAPVGREVTAADRPGQGDGPDSQPELAIAAGVAQQPLFAGGWGGGGVHRVCPRGGLSTVYRKRRRGAT